MRNIIYTTFVFLLLIVVSCKDNEQPYVGYIKVGRVVLESGNGEKATITADTDISNQIQITVPEEAQDWCSVSTNGKTITVTALSENSSNEGIRTAIIDVKCGYRETSFVVIQKFNGQKYLEYDPAKWTATGSDVNAGDGGGYPSLFTPERTTYWHSQYTNATPEHSIVVDMKQELMVAKVSIGRRYYAATKNNYPTVKKMKVYYSLDNIEFTYFGEFTFELPWTAPDGTVVNGNSPLVPADEEIVYKDNVLGVQARYFKMHILETNNKNGTCQVSYFKAFEKL